MADDKSAGNDAAPPARRSTSKGAVKAVRSAKKAAPRKTRATTAPRKVTPTKKTAAKRSRGQKAPAKKAAGAKRAAPAKRGRPTKNAAPALPAEGETTERIINASTTDDSVSDDELVAYQPASDEPVSQEPVRAELVEEHQAMDTPDAKAEVAPGWSRPAPPSPAPEAAREKKPRKKFFVAIVVLVGVAILAGAIYLIADLISNKDDGVGYTSLKPGDCFNNPPDNFKRVSTVACTRPHDLEVVAVVNDPSPKKAPYPGTAALVQTAAERCAPDFQVYVGRPVEQSQLRQVEIVPQKGSWDDGGRRLVCTVRSPDGAPSTGSARGSNR